MIYKISSFLFRLILVVGGGYTVVSYVSWWWSIGWLLIYFAVIDPYIQKKEMELSLNNPYKPYKIISLLLLIYCAYLLASYIGWWWSIGWGILFIAILPDRLKEERERRLNNPHKPEILEIEKTLKLYNNELNKGISIVGGAGSGKTFSLIVPLISVFYNTFYKRGILFDYKFPELTDEFKYIGFDINIFNPVHHEKSIKINPFDFCEDYSDFVKNWTDFYKNSRKDAKIGFFEQESINLLAAVSFSLKKQNRATLRNIVSAIAMNTDDLLTLLKSSNDLALTARKFEQSMKSDNQFAGVISSVIQVLEPIATENVFKITDFTEDQAFEIPLSIGATQNKIKVYTPLLAMVFNAFIGVIEKETTPQKTFILIDEAPMFIISDFSNYPATLRSKLVAIVCAVQDISQFVKNYGEQETRSIIANLHFKFFGKLGEPSSVKFAQDLIGTRTYLKRQNIDDKKEEKNTFTEKDSLISAKYFTNLNAGDFWSNIYGSFELYKMKVTPPIKKKTVDVNDFFKDLEKKIEKKEDNWV